MEKSCYFNKDSETYIYHFTKENLVDTKNIINMTNNKKIYYEKMENKDFNKNIEDIINKCKNNNILIVINSIDNFEISEIINNYAEKLKTKSFVLQNITMINYTNYNKKVLYYFTNKNGEEIFKKIINVFPSEGELIFNDANFFVNSKLDINIPKTVDMNQNILYTFVQKGGEIKNIIIRVMKTTNISNRLKDQWWFSWYFSIPACANIRLLQSTGTCWLNSAINSLFLSEEILNLIKMRYKDKKEYKIKFKDFEKNKNTEILCNALVYNLVINKTKAKFDDGNFVAYLASLIKCEYMNEPKKCKNIKYGDGGYAHKAIEIILKNIVEKDDFTCINLSEVIGEYDIYDEILKKYKEEYDEYQKIYGEYDKEVKNKYRDEYKIKNLGKKINEYNIKLKKYSDDLKEIQKSWENIEEKIKDYEIDNNDIFEKYDANKILVFSGFFDKNIKQNIIFNNKKYKLCASVVQSEFEKTTHVISGIVCNGKYYIYDSNNIFLQCDWYKGGEEIQNVFYSEKMKHLYGKIDFDTIYVLIYILDE